MPGLCRGGSGGGEAVVTQLIRYDAACRAIAAAKNVDEVKNIRDKAEALRAYGRLAKNIDIEQDGAEIRLRAERRHRELRFALGQLLELHAQQLPHPRRRERRMSHGCQPSARRSL